MLELTSENFREVALDPSTDVAVLLTTTWCHNCAEAKAAWAAAARRHLGGDGAGPMGEGGRRSGRRQTTTTTVFATFDVTADDPPTPSRYAHAAAWATSEVPVRRCRLNTSG